MVDIQNSYNDDSDLAPDLDPDRCDTIQRSCLFITIPVSCRPIEAETLQLFLSWIVEGFTSLEQLSSLARKHYLFLLAVSTGTAQNIGPILQETLSSGFAVR